MAFRRGAIALGSLVAFIFSITLAAQAPNPAPRKLSKAEEKERDTIYAIMTAATSGQMPNDLSLSWQRDDVLKASGNQQYVPFMVTIDPSKTQSKNLMMYWRVVSTSATPAPPAAAKGNDKGNDKNKPVQQFAYEGLTPATVSADGRLSRAIATLPGSYDVYVVVKEPTPEKAPKNAPAPKVSVIKKSLEVPDLWNGELNTSTVFVGRIDPLPAPLSPQQQAQQAGHRRGVQLLHEAGRCREVLQQNESTESERRNTSSTVRLCSGPSAAGGTGCSARVVPGGRLSARNQGHGQAREQDVDS
jgi:hypothetical protein